MQSKPLLIIQPATSYDDLPDLCADRGDTDDPKRAAFNT